MKNKYTTILFDADNTLLDFSKSERASLIKTMEDYGVPVTEDNVNTYVAINDSLWKRLEKKEITKPELKQVRFRMFFDSIGFSFNGDAFDVNEHYLGLLSQCGYTMDGAEALSKKLSDAGYELYIVTNGVAKTQAQRLEKSGLLPYFKNVFVSESIGIPKPDKRFFDYVLGKIPEKDKSKIVVIGDSLSSDIRGAENSGLDSIWLNLNGTVLPDDLKPVSTVSNLNELANLFL